MIKRGPAALGWWGGVILLLPVVVFAAPPARETALRAFINTPDNNVAVTVRADGKTGFLGADPKHPLPEVSLLRRPEERAHVFLKFNRDLFVDTATPLELVTARRQDSDSLGISHVRVQQTFRGIPIREAEAVVRLNAAGITAVSSKLISAPAQLSTTPNIGSEAALRTAQTVILKKYGPVSATFSVPQLEILDVGLFHGQPGQPHLTWFITANAAALYERIWINAASGALTYHYSQLTHARDRRIFDANNSSLVPAAPARSENQGPTGITEVDNGFDFTGDFWNYFYTVHGRDSYDGAGATLNATVRYCDARNTGCPMKGAFWDGTLSVQRIFLGAGYATDDVIAHEFTHAVIDSTSNLIYSGESGALNESYADIFGETIDLWNGKGNDAPDLRWMIGEELPDYTGTGLRNMRDPALAGQPGHVTDASYQCDASDNYGVHQNSSVANHAYALMVDGGIYNGYTINGIGLDKAAKIQYRTLLFLPAASRLVDNFDGLNQACNELTGTEGITSDDCAQVKAAALAVEMTTPPCDGMTLPTGDPAQFIIEGPNVLVTTEDAGVTTFTIVLNKPPSGDVYVPLSTTNAAEGRVTPLELVFTSSNWNQPQTVRVVGADDRVIDGDVDYQVIVGPVDSMDFEFARVLDVQLPATNKDNDKVATAAFSGVFLIGLLGIWMQRRHRLHSCNARMLLA